jgi:hypothetical protein
MGSSTADGSTQSLSAVMAAAADGKMQRQYTAAWGPTAALVVQYASLQLMSTLP